MSEGICKSILESVRCEILFTEEFKSNRGKDLGPVYTYPDNFESPTFSFRIRLSFTRTRRIRMQIHNFLNPLYRVEIFESENNLEPCGRANSGMN